jgi:hypothetical protein
MMATMIKRRRLGRLIYATLAPRWAPKPPQTSEKNDNMREIQEFPRFKEMLSIFDFFVRNVLCCKSGRADRILHIFRDYQRSPNGTLRHTVSERFRPTWSSSGVVAEQTVEGKVTDSRLDIEIWDIFENLILVFFR